MLSENMKYLFSNSTEVGGKANVEELDEFLEERKGRGCPRSSEPPQFALIVDTSGILENSPTTSKEANLEPGGSHLLFLKST